MTLDIKDRLYTSSEVAEILGVSLRSVYRYLEEGKLDADIKTATGRHRFSKKNILDFLQPSDNQNKVIEKKETLDQPIQNAKSFSSIDTIEDDFDFDNFFETDLVKNVNSTSIKDENPNKSKLNSDNSEYFDAEDDLEKLFEELEKEFAAQNNQEIKQEEKKVSKIVEDDFDFDFDFLDKNEDINEYLNSGKSNPIKEEKKESDLSDFDFDFLDSIDSVSEDKSKQSETNLTKSQAKDEDDFDFFNLDTMFDDVVESKPEPKSKVEDKKEDETEGWLERFRKASEKTETKTGTSNKNSKDEFDLSSFFTNKSNTSTISLKDESDEEEFPEVNEFKSQKDSRRREYYYISSLSGPKEIAQTIDKVSRKFDLDYAFTLNAGLSLHKDISPFTLIHVYTNERDLEIFEDYLKLTPSSEKDAHICIIPAKDREIFEDSYELNGLFVVSNVQLRSDFIDKGMDNYAREV